jgi:hypothetical protein
VKKYFRVLILILICLAVFIPFASNAPDGLERAAGTLGIEEHTPMWRGLMPDYTLPTIDNPYLSTLVAGTLGVFLVLAVALVLGIAMNKSSK